MNYLDSILESTKLRVSELKNDENLQSYINNFETQNESFSFCNNLKKDGLSIIAEIKKASPSKGIISKDFPYLDIAKEYKQFNVSAMSVLTEPSKFLGSNKIFSDISNITNIPLLRKDFIIDELQIYESKKMGADSILLIVHILTEKQIKDYIHLAHNLRLDVLVETHNEKEIEIAINCGANIIGINNRNLETFEVDIQTCLDLKKNIPSGIITVAESGISSKDDLKRVEEAGFDAVLIGESLMKSRDLLFFIDK